MFQRDISLVDRWRDWARGHRGPCQDQLPLKKAPGQAAKLQQVEHKQVGSLKAMKILWHE